MLRDGTRVIVARKPDPMPQGWGDTWYPFMDELIGQEGVIVDWTCGYSGYLVRMHDQSLFGDRPVTLPAEALRARC